MQVTEQTHEGLSRSYAVRILAAELGAALEARIAEVTPTLNLRGFRPGKVPAGHVRRLYGKALMGEVVEKTLNETSQKVLEERQLRIASRPDLKPVSDMDKVLAGDEDLAYEIAVEVMPDFEPMDVSTLALTRPAYAAPESEVDEALADLARQSRTYEDRKGKTAKAQDGDQLLIDFAGSIDGVAFDGGAAEDAEVVLGSGQLIPGFEAQLVGAAPGEARTVTVTFPADYSVEALKGREAVFAVTVKAVRAPKEAKADDALAERLGVKDLATLRETLRGNIEQEYAQASRFKLKRALLDALDAAHAFDLPPRMVETEFDSIWRELEHEKEHGHLAAEDAAKSEDDLRAEYRRIAERRVRLGLVLAEIGRRENVTVTEAELSDAMRREAMRYGEQAQQIFEFLKTSVEMQNQLRAPVYEEKVVDLILSRATVTDRPVSREALLADDDEPPAAAPARTKGKAPKAKAAAKTEEAPAEAAKEAKAPAKAKPKTVAKAPAAAKPAKKASEPTEKAAKTKGEKPSAAAPAKKKAKPAS